MPDTVIKAENLSKKCRLGVINRRMLVDQIESWVCGKPGKRERYVSLDRKSTV